MDVHPQTTTTLAERLHALGFDEVGAERYARLLALGYDDATAARYARLIGDSPVFDETGRVVIRDARGVLIDSFYLPERRHAGQS